MSSTVLVSCTSTFCSSVAGTWLSSNNFLRNHILIEKWKYTCWCTERNKLTISCYTNKLNLKHWKLSSIYLKAICTQSSDVFKDELILRSSLLGFSVGQSASILTSPYPFWVRMCYKKQYIIYAKCCCISPHNRKWEFMSQISIAFIKFTGILSRVIHTAFLTLPEEQLHWIKKIKEWKKFVWCLPIYLYWVL